MSVFIADNQQILISKMNEKHLLLECVGCSFALALLGYFTNGIPIATIAMLLVLGDKQRHPQRKSADLFVCVFYSSYNRTRWHTFTTNLVPKWKQNNFVTKLWIVKTNYFDVECQQFHHSNKYICLSLSLNLRIECDTAYKKNWMAQRFTFQSIEWESSHEHAIMEQ